MDKDSNKNDDAKRPIIIIKKIKKKHGNKHHGGSWKIAYADFVTAMMTFFLLLWLLSLLNKYQLEGISEYFRKPYKGVVSKKMDESPSQAKELLSAQKAPGDAEMEVADESKRQVKSAASKEKEEEIKKSIEEKARKEAAEEIETRKQSEAMKAELIKQMKSDPKISQYENSLNFVVTSQGLKIELKDLANKPMFSNGKTDFDKYAKDVLEWLGKAINKYPNRVMIIGHTDSKPYSNVPNYSNWELSVDRANATRRELIKSNMEVEKIVRIVGSGDIDKLDTAPDTMDPANRRIDIIVLTDTAFEKMQNE